VAITIATAAAVFGIFAGLSGAWIVAALAVEAELLFLAGLFLGQRYLRALALGALWRWERWIWCPEVPRRQAYSWILGPPWLEWSPAAC